MIIMPNWKGSSISLRKYQQQYAEEYAEILKGPHKSVISTDDGQKMKFKYIYCEQEKYLLGQGSFGRVYICFFKRERTEDVAAGQLDDPSRQGSNITTQIVKLALKIVEIPTKYEQIRSIEQIVATTRQEIRSLIKLSSNSNIIKIEDVIGAKNRVYLVLEYCNNKDLGSYLKKRKTEQKLTEKDILGYFEQILNGFKQLYKHKIIHRDIKPGNIMVHDGVLKIADFGLSKQFFEKGEQFYEDHAGTMSTASPQIIFKEPYTNKCDIYSLGATLYWMLYGIYPYKDNVSKEEIINYSTVFPKEISIVSPETIALLKSMLTYHERDRISWLNLFNHPLFQAQKIQREQQYNRDTVIGRNLRFDFADSLLIDNQISQRTYTYITEDDTYEIMKDVAEGSNSQQSLSGCWKLLLQVINQRFKLFFFKELCAKLSVFQAPDRSQHKLEIIMMRDVTRLGLQKLVLCMLTSIYNELTNKTPFSIFEAESVYAAVKLPFFDRLIQQVRNQVESYEKSTKKPKLTPEERATLHLHCEEYQVIAQFPVIFSTRPPNKERLLYEQLQRSVVEILYFIKAEISQLANKGSSLAELQFQRYRDVVLLAHSLAMLLMQTEMFPKRHDPTFNYDTAQFKVAEEYRDKERFNALAKNIVAILDRFQN